MLNITTITRKSIGGVVSYYADGADDYYAKDGQSMQWEGEGAKALGLDGEVDQNRFRELLNGKLSDTERLHRPVKEGAKERLGYDLTFSAPKGVSLQALVHGDHKIVQAHDRAVKAAIHEAERLAMARSTTQGKTQIEHTNNLAVATFRHETSRAKDPDLHTHAFVLNATQRADGQWRSLTNDGIVNSLKHLGNVYKAELAKELQKEGFDLRFDRNGTFDLAHFSEEQIKAFSARSTQIEAALAEQGLDRDSATQAQKNVASLSTRDRKEAGIDREQLRQEWQKRANELGIDFDSREWAGAGGRNVVERNSAPTIDTSMTVAQNADRCVEFAIRSTTERQAIVKERELLETATKHGYGVLSVGDVRAAMARKLEGGHLIRETPVYHSANADHHGKGGRKGKAQEGPALTRAEWIKEVEATGRDRQQARRLVDQSIANGRLLKGEARYTTHIAQQRERDILKIERRGRGAVTPSVTPEAARTFLDKQSTLHPEQRRTVETITTTANRFTAVQGYAGTGKSYMTTTAKTLLEANGHHVTALAPYGPMVRNLQADGMDARTVASFVKAADKKIGPGSVVFIDEAGVMPARQMKQVMSIIEQHGARAVLLGDTSQTKAIEAGKPFDQMMKAGIETSYMSEIQRQKDPELLKAVQLAAEGDTDKSMQHLKHLTEIKDKSSRHQQMVDAYTAQAPDERDRSIMITGTNESRHDLNAGVRERLELAGKGHHFELMNRLDSTQEERKHSRYYEKGAVIVPERDYAVGLKRGELYRVMDTGPGNRLTVKAENGEVMSFSPARCTKLSVYAVEKAELSPGDHVRISRNVAERDLGTHERYRVKAVQPESVLIENGQGKVVKLDNKQPLPMTYGYATTVHSSQGLTADRVFANLDSKSRTTVKEVYYVAVSRARHEAQVYTDSTKSLPDAIRRSTDKSAALELKQLRQHGKEVKQPEHDKVVPGDGQGQKGIEHHQHRANKERAQRGPERAMGR